MIWFLNIDDSISFFVSSILVFLFFITWFFFVSFWRYFFFQVTFGWWWRWRWFLFSLIFDRFTLNFWGAQSVSTIGTRMTLAFYRRTRFWIWKKKEKAKLWLSNESVNVPIIHIAHTNRSISASIIFPIYLNAYLFCIRKWKIIYISSGTGANRKEKLKNQHHPISFYSTIEYHVNWIIEQKTIQAWTISAFYSFTVDKHHNLIYDVTLYLISLLKLVSSPNVMNFYAFPKDTKILIEVKYSKIIKEQD